MYKVIAVDDERMVCKLLPDIIDYSEYGFRFVKAFQSAENALGFIEKNNIDLVLCDIELSGMSGIDFSKIIKEKYPHVKIIFISAYQNFEYAKQAIENNAVSYILKPFVFEEFGQALIKAKGILDNESSVQTDTLFNAQNIIRQYFDSSCSINELKLVFRQFSFEFPDFDSDKNFSVVNLSIPNMNNYLSHKWAYGQDRLYNAIRNIIPYQSGNMFVFVLNTFFNNIRFIIVHKKGTHISDLTISSFFAQCKSQINELLNLKTEFRIIISGEYLESVKAQLFNMDLIAENSELITDMLKDCKQDEAFSIYEKISSEFDSETKAEFISSILIQLKENFDMNCNVPEISTENVKIYNSKINDLFSEAVNSLKNISSKQIFVNSAIAYIKHNYTSNITLDSISKYVHINPTYFSTCFKEITGQNFTTFLARYRISVAKQILEKDPNIKIYNLCESIGYKSIPYLYKSFLTYEKISLTEYKQQIQNNIKEKSKCHSDHLPE